MNENKDLIEYKGIRGFFKKIFDKLFGKKDRQVTDQIDEPDEVKELLEKAEKEVEQQEQEENIEKTAENIVQEIVEEDEEDKVVIPESEKKEFFKIYNSFKEGKVNLEDLPFETVTKINKMMREEIKLKVQEYDDIEDELVEKDLESHQESDDE